MDIAQLSLNVDEYDSSIDFDLAVSTASYYGFSEEQADKIIAEIKNIVHDNWRSTAKNMVSAEEKQNEWSLRLESVVHIG